MKNNGKVGKWLKQPDCKSGALCFGSSNLSLPTIYGETGVKVAQKIVAL